MERRLKLWNIVKGGLAAGLVIIAVNMAAQALLATRMQAELDAWMPGTAERMQPSGMGPVAAGVAMKLVIGLVLVWLHAVARARVGAGPRGATTTALAVWVLGAIYFSDYPLTGMLSWGTYTLLESMQLLAFLAAAQAGALVAETREVGTG
ncbi:MAG: hypothetical protein AB7O67_08835 [Vicinamibacterales bacterium]